ncbi:hypothetical protein FRB94_002778 [Tulasnella sp. JGI-2019a]|nr:hypothetical protein FRB94_002778 [Tulasnella sp. JGI-2019a]KAG9012400.1 hypothetical protein FRB93_001823 [Tulasnella sp. JGI-2019a]KAG9031417.1 hypothetical protein FRB95_002781 [Tulasnella sp. JGI-2019a]
MASQSENGMDSALRLLVETAQQRSRQLNSNLKELDKAFEDFETLEYVMDEFGVKLRHAITTMRRRYNDRLPISQLPEELLINIFLFVICENPLLHYSKLHKLAEVLFHWASLIKTSPSLWLIVHTSHVLQLQTTAIDKSGASLLSLIDEAVKVPGKDTFLAMCSHTFVDGSPSNIPTRRKSVNTCSPIS